MQVNGAKYTFLRNKYEIEFNHLMAIQKRVHTDFKLHKLLKMVWEKVSFQMIGKEQYVESNPPINLSQLNGFGYGKNHIISCHSYLPQ